MTEKKIWQEENFGYPVSFFTVRCRRELLGLKGHFVMSTLSIYLEYEGTKLCTASSYSRMKCRSQWSQYINCLFPHPYLHLFCINSLQRREFIRIQPLHKSINVCFHEKMYLMNVVTLDMETSLYIKGHFGGFQCWKAMKVVFYVVEWTESIQSKSHINIHDDMVEQIYSFPNEINSGRQTWHLGLLAGSGQ